MKADQASSTARLIAMATIMWPELAPAGAARLCELLLQNQPRVLALTRSRLFRAVAVLLEKVLLPGAVGHWLGRKREIDRLAREAQAEGFSQLLVIGAGLDTLALRMAEEGAFARIITADHPATLSTLPVVDSRVERVPLDLTADDGLPALSPAPTLVVIEGVLMYLPFEHVERLLARLAQLPVARVRLIASWVLDRPGRAIGFREQSWLINAWLRRRGEPMLWATTPPELCDLLRRLGWEEPRLTRFALEGEQLTLVERR